MIEKDIGFVLRRYNFRETSLISTLYTSGFGKIKGIFKGFYTRKKEFSSSLDIFSLNEFVFYPKKSEIWLISHADLISDYPFLKYDLTKAKTGAIFLNLIDKVMQLWDRNTYVFDLMRNCLNYLIEEDESKILYVFLIKFLSSCGFKPELNHCVSCTRILEGEILFSASRGGLVCRNCYKAQGDVKIISKQVTQSLLYIQKTDFPQVCRLNLDLRCQEEIFYILKEFVAFHFDFNLDFIKRSIYGLQRQN